MNWALSMAHVIAPDSSSGHTLTPTGHSPDVQTALGGLRGITSQWGHTGSLGPSGPGCQRGSLGSQLWGRGGQPAAPGTLGMTIPWGHTQLRHPRAPSGQSWVSRLTHSSAIVEVQKPPWDRRRVIKTQTEPRGQGRGPLWSTCSRTGCPGDFCLKLSKV